MVSICKKNIALHAHAADIAFLTIGLDDYFHTDLPDHSCFVKVGGADYARVVQVLMNTKIKVSIEFIKHSTGYASFNTLVDMVLYTNVCILYYEALKLSYDYVL